MPRSWRERVVPMDPVMGHRLLFAALFTLLTAPAAAAAEATVRVVATDPAGETVTLGRDATFWVRVAYETDEPTQIWVRPYFRGAEVPVRSNASLRHLGSGEAIGWFAAGEPYQVDEIRVRLGGGTPYREWDALRVPVQITGTTAAAAPRTKAPWVDELLAAEAAALRAERERQASTPASAGDRAIVGGFLVAVVALFVAGIALPAWAAWRWRGGWRIGAVVALAWLGFVAARIVVDTGRDPTSHNLWPFEIAIAGAEAVAGVAVLALVRRVGRVARSR